MSWVYSVEWPIFAVLAVVGWWHLVHEDPAVYTERRESARRERAAQRHEPAPVAAGDPPLVESSIARAMAAAAAVVLLEVASGVVAVLKVPFSRPTGLLPHVGLASYGIHGILGAALFAGAGLLVARTRRAERVVRFAAWAGLFGVGIGGIGGLLTIDRAIVRFLGMGFMCLGPLLAVFSYGVVALSRRSRRRPPAEV